LGNSQDSGPIARASSTITFLDIPYISHSRHDKVILLPRKTSPARKRSIVLREVVTSPHDHSTSGVRRPGYLDTVDILMPISTPGRVRRSKRGSGRVPITTCHRQIPKTVAIAPPVFSGWRIVLASGIREVSISLDVDTGVAFNTRRWWCLCGRWQRINLDVAVGVVWPVAGLGAGVEIQARGAGPEDGVPIVALEVGRTVSGIWSHGAMGLTALLAGNRSNGKDEDKISEPENWESCHDVDFTVFLISIKL